MAICIASNNIDPSEFLPYYHGKEAKSLTSHLCKSPFGAASEPFAPQ